MNGQEVIAASSQDIRSAIASTGAGQAILLDYVSRIQQDVLHDSVYSHLNDLDQTITTVSGTYLYTLTGNLRSIRSVFDRTRQRWLRPEPSSSPVPTGDKDAPQPEYVIPMQGDAAAQSGIPLFYRLVVTNDLYVFPTPLQQLTLQVIAEKQVIAVTDVSTTLIVPSDAKDMMAAGVNYLASMFLKRVDEAGSWMTMYTRLKSGKGL